jgi:hypothetical protein
MSIKRYIATKDNTISAAFRENLTSRSFNSNMGASDILELFSIYGQASSSSLEMTRILSEFPVESISKDRDSSILPESGSVSFKLRFFNSEHGQTTPEDYQIVAHPVLRSWTEGDGLDMESYLNTEPSNWLTASTGNVWHSTGSDYGKSTYITSSIPMEHTQFLSEGTEDLNIDVTGLVEEWIKYYKGGDSIVAAAGSVTFGSGFENSLKKAPTATILVNNTTNLANDAKLILKDADGVSHTFTTNNGTNIASSGNNIIGISDANTVAKLGQAIAISVNAANSTTKDKITAAPIDASSATVTFTHAVSGIKGNGQANTESLGNSNTLSAFAGGLDDPTLTIRSHEGQEFKYVFKTNGTSAYSLGNTWYLGIGANSTATATILKDRVDLDFKLKIVTSTNTTVLNMTQSATGLHGNTNISSNIPTGDDGATIVNFTSGTGMPNYGMVVKLAEEYENGSKQSSYYTKKFLARGSHEYLRRPALEAQWDDSIKDDRNYIAKSSSLAPAAENLNTIFLYNKRRGSFYDLPNIGSNLVVSLHTVPSPTSAGEKLVPNAGGVLPASVRHITASKHATGVYKASFAYTGSQTFVYDVWAKSIAGVATTLTTGSGFTIYNESHDNSYEMPSYNLNITNLKDSYLKDERTTFRIYTRDKNWQPNIYTKASKSAPINNIRDLFYKITKVYDNYEVVSYSTGSTPSYSSVSYDNQGSFFDLDMTLLEPNNAYEISFLLKDGSDYIEQPEKFRFRVSP